MNILLYDNGSYIQKDLIFELQKAGHHCKNILYTMKDKHNDSFFEKQFSQYIREGNYDFVMSTNYYPIVARISFENNVKYLAWVYDSPLNSDHMEDYQFPNSYLFHFDRLEVKRLLSLGGQNIYHMPLAIIPHKYDNLKINAEEWQKYHSEISFIGQFYPSPLTQIMICQNDYDKGYIDALVQTQLKIYGCNFIEELINEELIKRLNKCIVQHGSHVEGLNKRGLAFSIDLQVTHLERIILCSILGKHHLFKYYSFQQPGALSHLKYCGTASYYKEMPIIFKLSKLNLNPTLKSIQSGIPLRALDILNSGGLLFSNYQCELAENFTDGTDVVMYESMEDAIEKADYYLRNESLRAEIAIKGQQRVSELYIYPNKLKEIFEIAGIS